MLSKIAEDFGHEIMHMIKPRTKVFNIESRFRFGHLTDQDIGDISDICQKFSEKFVMLTIYYYKIRMIIL